MAELGTVGVRIEGNWDAFKKQAADSVRDVGKSMSSKITGGIGAAATGTLKVIGKVATGVGLIGTAAAGFGIKAAADMETLNLALVQLTGSEEAAQQQLAELSDFAEKTPFDMPGLANAQNALLATGKISREDVIPTLRGIGDSVAALGGSTADVEAIGLALQKSFAKGKVDLETLNIVTERGIPVMAELAAQMGVAEDEIAKLISSGKVAPEVLQAAFQNPQGPLKNFTGATEKLSQTFHGMWGTLKDTVEIGLAQALTPALKSLVPVIGEIIPVAGSLIGTLGVQFGDVLVTISRLLSSVLPVLEPLIQALGSHLTDALQEVFDGFGEVIPEIMTMAEAVLPALMGVLDTLIDNGLSILLPIISRLATMFANVGPPILEVVAALLDALLPVLGDLVFELAMALIPVVEALVALFEGGLSDVLFAVLDLVKPFIPVLGSLAQLVSAMVIPIVQAFSEALSVVAGWLSELSPAFSDMAAKISEGLAQAIEKVRSWFADLPELVKRWLSNAGSWLVNTGKNIIEGLWNGIKSMGNWLKDKVTSALTGWIPGPIKNALGIHSPSRVMMGIGANIGEGLALGLLGAEREVRAASSRLAAAAAISADGSFSSVLGSASQARIAPVVMEFNAPVGGSMADFAREIEQQRALTARFV